MPAFGRRHARKGLEAMVAASGTRSLKERQREEREELILQAAADLLTEQGYHETSIDQIAARVGIAKGTVYLHFSSKEELVIALLKRGMREFVRAIEDTLAGEGSPSEKLRTIIEHVYRGLSGRQELHMTTILQSPELRRQLADRREALVEQWQGPMRQIAALIDEGKAAGEFDATVPTPVMVLIFTSVLTPRGYQQLVVQQGISVNDAVGYLCRCFFKGIAADELRDLPQESDERCSE